MSNGVQDDKRSSYESGSRDNRQFNARLARAGEKLVGSDDDGDVRLKTLSSIVWHAQWRNSRDKDREEAGGVAAEKHKRLKEQTQRGLKCRRQEASRGL